MANSILVRGLSEKESVEFGVLPNHPPPTTKGGMFAIRRVTPGREDTKKERRQNEDEVYGVDAVFVVGFGRKY
jgi:hypothetical protein